MRRALRLTPAAYALFLGLNAAAADTPKDAPAKDVPKSLASAFGNTVKATYPDGRFQRYWFQPDGSWRAIGRRGHSSSGHWTAHGDEVCLKQSKPIPSPMKYCTTFPASARVGSSWPAKDMGGGAITLSVVKGKV
ncbi:MAG: hypothetical protein JF588_08690 [Caulobacterales bacterium]|nr:hypothetical protein [Caulobacterales bacterium]